MGSAIAERLQSSYQIFAFDKDRYKTARARGIEIVGSAHDAVSTSEGAILAVKPQDFSDVLREIKDSAQDRLIISIAAGIPTGEIEKILGPVRVIRAMPNIGITIKEAESGVCAGKYAQGNDLANARAIFGCMGQTWVIEEAMMDAMTAISGSGPAYIFYDMETQKIDPDNVPKKLEAEYARRLQLAARAVGFDDMTAMNLSASVTRTSLHLPVKTGMPPSQLRAQVTSKGGTTEAAVQILAQGGTWTEAALSAVQRAKELARG
jgi:pyrroline-5-carboxylate reductase